MTDLYTQPDSLTNFAQWWMANRPILPPMDCYMHAGCNTGTVLFRQAPWQVQLFACEPNGTIPDHTHPHVDSYEVYAGGEVYLRHRGIVVLTPEMIEGGAPPMSLSIRVLPSDVHGGWVGAKGGSFISIQQWLDDIPPTSVHYDWDGPALDKSHGIYLAGIA